MRFDYRPAFAGISGAPFGGPSPACAVRKRIGGLFRSLLWAVAGLVLLPAVIWGQVPGEASAPPAPAPVLFLSNLLAADDPSREEDAAQPAEGLGEVMEETAKVLAKAVEKTKESIRGRSLTLGPSFTLTDFQLFRDEKFSDGTTPKAKLTDNGRLNLFQRFQTEESYFVEVPMQVGFLRLGYNFITYLTFFETDKQEVLDGVFGEELGTGASGHVIGFAPFLFMVIGPLYPDTEIYWKTGLGVGVASIQYEAVVLFRNNRSPQTSRERLSDSDFNLSIFSQALWELNWERWVLTFQITRLTGDTQNGYFKFLERSLSLGYTFTF